MIIPARKLVILAYLALVSLVTYFVWRRDKSRAMKEQRRISEKALLKLTAAGGRFGAIVWMNTFRHKKFKGSFLWKFRLITGIEMLLIIYVLLAY